MLWEKLSDDEILEKLPGVNGNFQLLCSFLALLSVAATVKDSLGRLLYANRAAMKLYGKKPGELIGKTIETIIEIPKAELVQMRRIEKRVISQNRANILFQQLGSVSDPLRHSVLKFPFHDADDDPVVVSIIFPTHPKQLEK